MVMHLQKQNSCRKYRVRLTVEEYYVNRWKAFLRRLFNKENILLTPYFSLVRNFDEGRRVTGQHIRNKFVDSRIEFFLFNFREESDYFITSRFVVTDAHERLHRLIGFEVHERFKGEEDIIKDMCWYAFYSSMTLMQTVWKKNWG